MVEKENNDGPVQINIQIPHDVREDFKIVANHRGASMSNVLYQYILKLIREAKKETPEIFPNFDPPPKIVNESGMDEILFEALDGKPMTPEKKRIIEIAVRTALQVQEKEQGDNEKIN